MKVLHDPTHNPTDQSAFMNPDELDASANDQESMDGIAGGNEPAPEFVVRHIPLIPLFSLLIIAGNFFIFFALFT